MANRKNNAEPLAKEIANKLSTADEPNNKSTVYSHYQNVLRDTLAHHPAGTKLPPVRTLAQSMGVSLVTAQRVITGLIQEGTLESRPRAGVFISEPHQHTDEKKGKGSPSYFESTFSFGTPSEKKYQQPLWQELLSKFSELYPNIKTSLITAPSEGDDNPTPDAYEQLDWNVDWKDKQGKNLDLRTSAPSNIQALATPDGLLPLYHRTNFLFFNPQLLKKYKIPEPSYNSFDEQTTYIIQIGKILKSHGFNPRPFSVQQPITLLGINPLQKFFELVDSTNEPPEEFERFSKSVGRVLKFCELCERAPGFSNPLAADQKMLFEQGKLPLYLGHSVDYWRYAQNGISFKSYPVLCQDDSLFLWPMVGTVPRKTQHPIEAIRFLSYLIGKVPQQRLVSTGVFAADLSPDNLPETIANSDWLAKALAESKPFSLPTARQFYLAIHIFNNELWHALLNHVEAKHALSEALQLGRIFTLQQNEQTKS